MPRRIAVSNLNASTIDILNTIRDNASAQYQDLVPEVETATDIPRVGDVLYGYPALANQFVSALVNRIAMVRIKSATFNNRFAPLKKGYLEFGETIEEVFIDICKAKEFSAEKAHAREHRRYLPKVRSAFHAINWRVMYPVTVQDTDIRQAFTSLDGVQNFIAGIVRSVYTAAEYDEYLLFKYLIIKAVSHGKMKPVAVDTTNMDNAAIEFRGTSNQMEFMSTQFNISGVTTTTPKADQYIIMDAKFNARYDVEVLARAFNMDKADFMGRLQLVDSFTTFDNDRFSDIMAESDGLEPVTAAELALMEDVIGVLADSEWFQVYDNVNKMTEQYTASGLYTNYFYHVWKTISTSPFSNAVVFVDNSATIAEPATVSVNVEAKSVGPDATVFTLVVNESTPSLQPKGVKFIQTEDATEAGIAIHPYGAVIMPNDSDGTTMELSIGNVGYTATAALTTDSEVGDSLSFAKNA